MITQSWRSSEGIDDMILVIDWKSGHLDMILVTDWKSKTNQLQK